MSDELKPCPFCGHPGGIERTGAHGMLRVGCMVDDPDICLYDPATITTEAELAGAVADWSRRVPGAGAGVPVEVVDALEGLLMDNATCLERHIIGEWVNAQRTWLDAQGQEVDE